MLKVNTYQPLNITNKFIDDIECKDWLHEIDMMQYEEVFLVNFSLGGKLLSRKRLGQVRQQDLSKMNITNFEHQKILMDHIRHTLEYSFHSPVRKQQSKEKYLARTPVHLRPPAPPVVPEEGPKYHIKNDEHGEHKRGNKGKKGKDKNFRRKRRSFDNAVWNKINALRTKEVVAHDAAEDLRHGRKPAILKEKEDKSNHKHRTRRYSFGENTPMDQLTAAQKGNLYGNMAMEYDIIQKEMATIKAEHLLLFQSLINCSTGRIYFLSEHTREVVVLIGHEWYRESVDSDVAGACAISGNIINIKDAYNDPRFNKNLDTITGFKTRNILCMPVRANRGGGRIIGVIQMLNKLGTNEDGSSADFDDSDEAILADCVQRIADDIHMKFKELLNAAESLTGSSTFVAESSTTHGSSYASATAASKSHAVDKYEYQNDEIHTVHEKGFNIQDDDAVKKISDRNIQDRRMHALDDYKRNSVDHGKDHEDGDKSGSGNATADSKGSGLFVGDEEKEMFPDEMEADAK